MNDYSEYDLSENDPYVIAGSTCLINKLGFTNTADLNRAEAELTKLTMAELFYQPVAATFDLKHLQTIHQRLFEDVYAWAGQFRSVEIAKGGALFLPYRLIHTELTGIFQQLHDEHLLARLTLAEFGQRAGFYLAQINKVHAFREGNGRTQRLLIEQLANHNGYMIDWNSISQDAMGQASRAARTQDPMAHQMSRLIMLNTLSIQE
jgi:cell filamentation protein